MRYERQKSTVRKKEIGRREGGRELRGDRTEEKLVNAQQNGVKKNDYLA